MTQALRKPTPLRAAFSATPEEESRPAAIREAIAQIKAESNAQHRVPVAPVVDALPAGSAQDALRQRIHAESALHHAAAERTRAEQLAREAAQARCAVEQRMLAASHARRPR